MTSGQRITMQAIANTLKDEAMHIERLIATNATLQEKYIDAMVAAEMLITGNEREVKV